MLRKTKIALISTLAIAGASCSPLAPRPDPSQYFLLTPMPASAVATMKSNRQLAIGLGPIDFPDYLRRAEVVTRSAPNQIVISDRERWAEPFDRNFERTLSYNLASLLNTQRIEEYPWTRRSPIDYQIAINVQRFETDANGQSQLIARWIIKDGHSGGDLYASETIASTTVATGDTGASAALSADLGKLSSDIASRITALNQERRGGSVSETSPTG
jgi:uncharacterized lipoprotein YmbA